MPRRDFEETPGFLAREEAHEGCERCEGEREQLPSTLGQVVRRAGAIEEDGKEQGRVGGEPAARRADDHEHHEECDVVQEALRARIDGFAFDVELLILAGWLGYRVGEVPVRVENPLLSTVSLTAHTGQIVRDLWRIHQHLRRGVYAPLAHAKTPGRLPGERQAGDGNPDQGEDQRPGASARYTKPRGHQTISAVVLTKNEAARIHRCLASLVAWVDEVVVVDDESVDHTRAICERLGAKVLVRPSHGYFDQQRNAGTDAAQAAWILQLDADEIVTRELQAEIRSITEQARGVVAFRIHRENFFLGHQMRWGGWGGWMWNEVKLFRKSRAHYVGSIHESAVVDGPIGQITSPILHYPFERLSQFVERQNFYSSLEARVLRERHPELSSEALRRQLCIRPLKLFWKSYIKKQGWREGMYGLVFGALFAWVEFLKWTKWWERGFSRSRSEPLEPPTVSRSQRRELQEGARERLTVVVLTKNEENKIARCLESVQWADEVVVVDGLSTDRTVEICRVSGATVVSHPFEGSFAIDRNLGLSHATGDWVLQIDADDIVTPEFREAAEAMLRSRCPHAALRFHRRSVLLGRVMRYGGWYYTVPNLVRRTKVSYEGLVHEHPVIDGTTGELPADIEHHPCEDLTAFVARHNRYTSLQAEELFRMRGKLPNRAIAWQLYRRPWKVFWKSYVKKQGFREEFHGLVFALFFAGVEFLKWAKYWEQTIQAPVLHPPPITPDVVEEASCNM